MKTTETVMLNTPAFRTPDDVSLDRLDRDEEGFLLDVSDWHPGLVEELAAEAELELIPERREIIRYIRAYLETHESVPEARKAL
jgi:TusE/DsrC/DsvC family sulfur relay protein